MSRLSVPGLDLSHHNYSTLRPPNFELLNASKYEYAYFKATEGGAEDPFIDEAMPQWVAGWNKPHGLYHFQRPQFSGRSQANLFIEAGHNHFGKLPNALDSEAPADNVAKNAIAFFEAVREYDNRRWLLYTNMNFLKLYYKPVLTEILFHADIWLSWPAWAAAEPYWPSIPFVPPPSVVVWQRSWWGNVYIGRNKDHYEAVPGTYGAIDLNLADPAWLAKWQEQDDLKPPVEERVDMLEDRVAAIETWIEAHNV